MLVSGRSVGDGDDIEEGRSIQGYVRLLKEYIYDVFTSVVNSSLFLCGILLHHVCFEVPFPYIMFRLIIIPQLHIFSIFCASCV